MQLLLLLLLLCILRSWYLEDTAALTASWLLLGLPHNLDMWQKLMTGNRRQVPRASHRIAIQSNPKTKTIHKTFHSHRIASHRIAVPHNTAAQSSCGWLAALFNYNYKCECSFEYSHSTLILGGYSNSQPVARKQLLPKPKIQMYLHQ